ncbi:MAG: SdiA-regulated domain-containing protein [Pseudomonadota bacterium]
MRVLSLAVLLLSPLAASALDLTLRQSIDMRGPSSLEFDPALCGVWIANEGREVAFMGPSGEITRRFDTALFTAKAITVDGDDLLISDGTGRFERRSKTGEQTAEPFRMPGEIWDVEGLIARADGGIVFTQDANARVWSLTAEGEEAWSIDGFRTSPPMVEPQGIAYDRRTGALYVVDDQEGSNAVFEFSPEGALLARVPLSEFGRDPEGIAIQADTGTMWIGFDDGNRLAVFDYLPTLREDAPDAASDACLMF